jgi:hypothetical protein
MTNQLTVSTTSDTAVVNSPNYTTTAGSQPVTSVVITRSNSTAGASGVTDTISFKTSATGGLSQASGSTITIGLPAGTNIDALTGATVVTDTTAASTVGSCTETATGSTTASCFLYGGRSITAGHSVAVTLAGVVNPGAGSYTATVSTTSDTALVGTPTYVIGVAGLTVSASQADPSGLTQNFVATPSGATAYAWKFGDGGTATTAVPTVSHTYGSAGTYTATVTETTATGNAVASVPLTISSCASSCTPTVVNGAATTSITQEGSKTGALTLSVSPGVLQCSSSYSQPGEISTLSESSRFSSRTPLVVTVTMKGIASTAGVKVCYQKSGTTPPPAPSFLKTCGSLQPAPCVVSIITSGPDLVKATLHVPPGDPRFYVGGPNVSVLFPTSAVIGSKIVLTGTGLNQIIAVFFSGPKGTFIAAKNLVVVSPTKITLIVPSGTIKGLIEVVSDGQRITSTRAFTPLP